MNRNRNMQLFIKIEITSGLTSVREVAAFFRSRGLYSKAGNPPDCVLSVVTQPPDSRLSDTSKYEDMMVL